jgi:hypothetical protein
MLQYNTIHLSSFFFGTTSFGQVSGVQVVVIRNLLLTVKLFCFSYVVVLDYGIKEKCLQYNIIKSKFGFQIVM